MATSPWGGTSSEALGRFLICMVFFVTALQKFQTFNKETGGPLMPWMTPKVDAFLKNVHQLTGFQIPIEKAMYPQLMLTSATVEFTGAMLFASDIRFGAWVLLWYTTGVSIIMHNFWDYAGSPSHMQVELHNFLKNVAVAGGLAYYLATSKGTRHKNKFQRWQEEVAAQRLAGTAPGVPKPPAAAAAPKPTAEEKKAL